MKQSKAPNIACGAQDRAASRKRRNRDVIDIGALLVDIERAANKEYGDYESVRFLRPHALNPNRSYYEGVDSE